MFTSLLFLSLSFIPLLADAAGSTIVVLTDAELNQLLQVVFSSLNGSTHIPFTLLQSLGLDGPSVIRYLIKLGYTIVYNMT
jgi:hypothetical protein